MRSYPNLTDSGVLLALGQYRDKPSPLAYWRVMWRLWRFGRIQRRYLKAQRETKR